MRDDVESDRLILSISMDNIPDAMIDVRRMEQGKEADDSNDEQGERDSDQAQDDGEREDINQVEGVN